MPLDTTFPLSVSPKRYVSRKVKKRRGEKNKKKKKVKNDQTKRNKKKRKKERQKEKKGKEKSSVQAFSTKIQRNLVYSNSALHPRGPQDKSRTTFPREKAAHGRSFKADMRKYSSTFRLFYSARWSPWRSKLNPSVARIPLIEWRILDSSIFFNESNWDAR